MNSKIMKMHLNTLVLKKCQLLLKYDGLAAGKGVDICDSPDEANSSIKNLLKPDEKYNNRGFY